MKIGGILANGGIYFMHSHRPLLNLSNPHVFFMMAGIHARRSMHSIKQAHDSPDRLMNRTRSNRRFWRVYAYLYVAHFCKPRQSVSTIAYIDSTYTDCPSPFVIWQPVMLACIGPGPYTIQHF